MGDQLTLSPGEGEDGIGVLKLGIEARRKRGGALVFYGP